MSGFHTRPVKAPGQAEWRDYRACWWDNDTASMAFGPVLRVLVSGYSNWRATPCVAKTISRHVSVRGGQSPKLEAW
jgi:hypothetical protein